MMADNNAFNAKKQFELNGKTYNYYHMKALEEKRSRKDLRITFFNPCPTRICFKTV